jgi:hypothetical protein
MITRSQKSIDAGATLKLAVSHGNFKSALEILIHPESLGVGTPSTLNTPPGQLPLSEIGPQLHRFIETGEKNISEHRRPSIDLRGMEATRSAA